MQQPLCHLYFLTVMENLWTEQHFNPDRIELTHFVLMAGSVHEELKTAEGGEAVLLWVELHAVVQVLIQQLALHFDPSQTHRLGDVQRILDDINRLEEYKHSHAMSHIISQYP